MALETKVKVGGIWKVINTIQVKVGGAWKDLTTIEAKVAGVWKTVHTSGTPDIVISVTIEHSAGKSHHYDGFLDTGLGSVNPTSVDGHLIKTIYDQSSPAPAQFRVWLNDAVDQDFFDSVDVDWETSTTNHTSASAAFTHPGGGNSQWIWAGSAVDWTADVGEVRDVTFKF